MNIRPLIIFPLCNTCTWIILNVLPAQPPPMVQMNCIAYCVLILLIIYIQLNYAFYFIAGFVLLYLVFFQCSRQPHLVSSPLKYRMTIFLANILCLTTFMLIFSVQVTMELLPSLLTCCLNSSQFIASAVLNHLLLLSWSICAVATMEIQNYYPGRYEVCVSSLFLAIYMGNNLSLLGLCIHI